MPSGGKKKGDTDSSAGKDENTPFHAMQKGEEPDNLTASGELKREESKTSLQSSG